MSQAVSTRLALVIPALQAWHLALQELALGLAHVAGEDRNEEEEDDAVVEGEEVIEEADVVLVVAELLLCPKAKKNGELLLALCLPQTADLVNIEHVLAEDVERLHAEDDLGLEGEGLLSLGLLQLYEEPRHHYAQKHQEHDRRMAKEEDELGEAEHEEGDWLKNLVNKALALAEDPDVLQLQVFVVLLPHLRLLVHSRLLGLNS